MSRGKVLLVADIKQISEHIAAKKCVPHFSSHMGAPHSSCHTAYTSLPAP
eukprot:COSAG06_NODE_52716_length_304_cov_0.751220_1_plen_49_part_10